MYVEEDDNLHRHLSMMPAFLYRERQLLEDIATSMQGFPVHDRANMTVPKTLFPGDFEQELSSFLDNLPDGDDKFEFIKLLLSRDDLHSVSLVEVEHVNVALESKDLTLRSIPADVHRLADRLFAEHAQLVELAEARLRMSELPQGDLNTEFEQESLIVDIVE